MIKKNIKLMIITSIIILLPMIAGLILWNQLPDSMPVHWNFNGEVDGWSSKGFAVLFFPLLLLGIHWLCFFGTSLDPKHNNHSPKMLTIVMWCIPVLSVVLHGFIYAFALGKDVKIEVVVPLLVGIVITIVGNYLPKCKHNYTIGIKVPWTLHSEENWNKTHRFGGVLWSIGGILIVFSSFIGFMELLLAVILFIAIVPVVYSYLLFKQGI